MTSFSIAVEKVGSLAYNARFYNPSKSVNYLSDSNALLVEKQIVFRGVCSACFVCSQQFNLTVDVIQIGWQNSPTQIDKIGSPD